MGSKNYILYCRLLNFVTGCQELVFYSIEHFCPRVFIEVVMPCVSKRPTAPIMHWRTKKYRHDALTAMTSTTPRPRIRRVRPARRRPFRRRISTRKKYRWWLFIISSSHSDRRPCTTVRRVAAGQRGECSIEGRRFAVDRDERRKDKSSRCAVHSTRSWSDGSFRRGRATQYFTVDDDEPANNNNIVIVTMYNYRLRLIG